MRKFFEEKEISETNITINILNNSKVYFGAIYNLK